jgi:hypothetical protein
MDAGQAHRLIEARLLAHHAAQWIARATRSYLSPKDDDSHTALDWLAAEKAFISAPSPNGVVGLDVSSLTLFALASDGKRVGEVAVAGQTEAATGNAFKELLGRAGYDPAKFNNDLPYTIPAHAVAKGGVYNAAAVQGDLAELAALFNQAHALLDRVRAGEASASPVRTWPHHFDMASLIAVPGKAGASVNAGFSPGDDHYAEPYYYVSPYPYPPAGKLAPNPAYHWHTENFTAAIMPLGRWPSDGREAFLAKGLSDAIAACKAALA